MGYLHKVRAAELVKDAVMRSKDLDKKCCREEVMNQVCKVETTVKQTIMSPAHSQFSLRLAHKVFSF